SVLHQHLTAAAERAGVDIVDGHVRRVEQDDTGVTAAGLRARYLVAAAGLHSTVRRAVGIDQAPTRGPRRWGLRQHFTVDPWSDHVEVHWADGLEAYVTPVGADCVNVAILSARRAGFTEQLAAFPELRRRLGTDVADRPRAA